MSLVKCPECGKEISDRATSCPNCGCPVEKTSIPQGLNNQPPVNKKKKGHGCLIPSIFLLALLIGLCVAVSQGVKDVEEHPEKYDGSVAKKYIDVTTDVGKQIDDILAKCGIENVSSFTHDELLDNAHKKGETGYRLKCDRADNVILYLNKNMKVHSIVYADHKLYSKGKIRATIQDFTFSMEEISKYQYLCEEKVKTILKSPSTAKFPNFQEWGFSKEKNSVTVQGYVDAQNSFGAETRSEFQFIIDSGTNTIKSFVFDGEEFIK